MKKRFLLEIGCEELPPFYIEPALEKMKSIFKSIVKVEDLKIYATYRRIILYGYIFCSTNEIKEAVITLLKRVSFPKTMYWSDKSFRFPRPIRWILFFVENRILKIKIADTTSSNFTCIQDKSKFMKSLEVKSIEEFFKILRRKGIIFSHKEREEFIKKELKKICSKLGAEFNFEPNLLKEVNFLVEVPFLFVGKFKEEYIHLPQEVLVASMSKYQRLFPLMRKRGGLLNKFVAVLETKPSKEEKVRKNFESILDARLKDALFFMEEDLKKGLEERIPHLKEISLIQGTGTLYDKCKRISELSIFLNKVLNTEINNEDITLSSYLCKVDLTTQMVREFPSLQGIIGRFYARRQNYPEFITEAIYEHYLPRFHKDRLPSTPLGKILSLADKMDTLCGCFLQNLVPTGDKDPYSLRRQALGCIRICIEKNVDLNLEEFISFSLQLWVHDFHSLKEQLMNFFKERLRMHFLNFTSYKDLIEAVLGCPEFNIYRMYKKLKELDEVYTHKFFINTCKVCERCYKITKKFTQRGEIFEVKEDLLIEEEERKLYRSFQDIKVQFLKNIESKDYKKATKIYASLYKAVDSFFEKVMVNVEDEKLRNNRIGLLQGIYLLYKNNIADLKYIKKT